LRYRPHDWDSQGEPVNRRIAQVIVAALLLVAATGNPISGTWEGTSLCQVKPSPCHGEHVIYRVKQTAPHRYQIDAYKLVAGQELFTGVVDVAFDPATGLLDGAIASRAKAVAQLRLNLRGARLTGRMSLTDGTLYRLIDVAKR
jgi:hypothetical protein